MTGDIFGPDGFLALGLAIVWGAAVYRLGRIGYAASHRKMQGRIRGALVFLLLGSALAAVKLAYDASLWPGGWTDWRNKLILQVPLLAAPAALTLLLSVPRLARACRQSRQEEAAARPDGAFRRKVADPLAVVPAQATAVGSCFVLYLSAFAAVPLSWADLAVPLPLMALAAIGLWFRQRKRRRTMGRISWTLPAFAVRAARGSLALAIAAACLVIWFRGSEEAGKLPGVELSVQQADLSK